MVFHIVQNWTDPSIRFLQMLVPVKLEKFVNPFSLVAPHLNEGRVCAGRIYMLLSFRGSAESAAGLVSTQSDGTPFGKIGGMGHPVKYMFRSSPYLSRRLPLTVCKGCHERCTVLRPARRFVSVDTLHIPRLSLQPKLELLGSLLEGAMKGYAISLPLPCTRRSEGIM
jgi:hypothetical protein